MEVEMEFKLPLGCKFLSRYFFWLQKGKEKGGLELGTW